MKVADMTLEELRDFIAATVRQELERLAIDPDEGLELADEVRERLQAVLEEMKSDGYYQTLADTGTSLQKAATILGTE
jgi:hypothetical protein